ncbi:Uncharacterised protein [Vibrio cholerae]|nr:Uncharacterised protein [Vibrio cholerae]
MRTKSAQIRGESKSLKRPSKVCLFSSQRGTWQKNDKGARKLHLFNRILFQLKAVVWYTFISLSIGQELVGMPRFIQILQIIIAVVIGAVVGYDLILNGISIFNDKYVTITCGLFVLLEIALFVIYKLIEED